MSCDSTAGSFGMYTAVYIYRVPKRNTAAFLRVQKEASEIYKRYGALADETFSLILSEAKYGCAAFPIALDVGEDEEVFLGLSRFLDRAHHDKVMAQVDKDDRINELYSEVIALFDIARVVRGEFECVA